MTLPNSEFKNREGFVCANHHPANTPNCNLTHVNLAAFYRRKRDDERINLCIDVTEGRFCRLSLAFAYRMGCVTNKTRCCGAHFLLESKMTTNKNARCSHSIERAVNQLYFCRTFTPDMFFFTKKQNCSLFLAIQRHAL